MVKGRESVISRIPSRATKTNIDGAFTIARPPAELNVKSATLRTLLRHGLFLGKPPSTASAELRDAWNETVGALWRSQNFVIPNLKPRIGVTHQLQKLQQTDSGYTSNNWSGAAILGYWSGAFGRWTVPTIEKPTTPVGADGKWHSSSWVGLDGLGGSIVGADSTDVLQAGVTQIVDANGVETYYAWFEWYVPPDNSDKKTWSAALTKKFPYIHETQINIPIAAGDVVAVAIQYVKNRGDNIGNPAPPPGPYNFGGINFGNLTTGQYTTLYLEPPTGASFVGDSAEWIMELNDNGAGTLPKFGSVVFDTAGACDSKNSSSPIYKGDLITLMDPTPNTSQIAGEASLTIGYVG
jgi:hypothetical protein